jgi:ArsR family transcriptional regulator
MVPIDGRRYGWEGERMRREVALEASAPAACCIALAAPAMTESDAGTTAEVFRALGDPHRVRIVNLLANARQAVCVCDLTPLLGISQPTVSHHLKKLTDAGLLRRERRGVWAFYSVDRAALERVRTVFELGGPS